jgi:type II restriction/modification system DNA methylase subunit YeeA
MEFEVGDGPMNRNKLKTYAPQARREFIQAVTDRAALIGLSAKKTEPMTEQGDVVLIAGKPFEKSVADKRRRLEARIKKDGFEQTMEAVAYTWFNRFVAIRYMELHGYLEHGYRVLSSAGSKQKTDGSEDNSANRLLPSASSTPEVLHHAEHVEFPGLKRDAVIDLKLAGNREGELYRLLLIAQCNALSKAMPFLFEKIDDETELLLPDNLLHTDSLIRKLVREIDEEDWEQVEIIGWLYQFYISEKKDQVIGKVVASEDIPAATQLFTPNWIVKYLVQNTLGRQWLEHHPASPLREKMEYYIEPAEQTPEVQAQLQDIIRQRTLANRGLSADSVLPTADFSLNPEAITFLDPACGSGHILVEAYDLFKAIYQEKGYRAKDIPSLILQKNLFGLEIDDRAAQLAAFALMMKARSDDKRIFESEVQPNISSFVESKGLNAEEIAFALEPAAGSKQQAVSSSLPSANCLLPTDLHAAICQLHALFENAKTFGSLIQIPSELAATLPELETLRSKREKDGDTSLELVLRLKPLVQQAMILAGTYDAVVANPPYMGSKYYTSTLKAFVNKEYKQAKADLYACFMERNRQATKPTGFHGMINIPNWMFLSSFEELRKELFETQTIDTFVHNGRGVFGSDFGSCAFVVRKAHLPDYRGSYRRLFEKQGSVASNEELEKRFHLAKTYTPSNAEFARIPGNPVGYWVARLSNFAKGTLFTKAESGGRFKTHNDEKYVRLWPEIDCSAGYWKPYLKGGEYRRFYGNEYHVADWRQSALDDYNQHGGLANPKYYGRQGITCSKITASVSSFRVKRAVCEFSSVSPTIFLKNQEHFEVVLAYLNSKVFDYYQMAINPTITTNVNDILAHPDPLNIIQASVSDEISLRTHELVKLAQEDWDAHESSMEFVIPPILRYERQLLRTSQRDVDAEYLARLARMKSLEEENNRLFIEAYGLQDELTPEVPDDQITLYRPDREEDIKRHLSYAVGCMMGRYSLDKPGLIYAHSANEGFDPSQYTTFRADDDGLVPLLEGDWGIADDATCRFVEFIGVAWPKEHLDENLEFVAESLGPKKDESPQETIRRYFATGFFKHHLRMYKNRPIYWLFSSGKQRAFQCLVYLHRYNAGTLARMRTEYVIPLQGQIAARIEQLEGDKASATSTSRRTKLQKEQDKLKKQHTELATFEEKLKHYADQRITLDLDDGVKVNYAKFGDLLAETKSVTGGKEE